MKMRVNIESSAFENEKYSVLNFHITIKKNLYIQGQIQTIFRLYPIYFT